MFPDIHARYFYLKDVINWLLGALGGFNIEKNIIIIVSIKPLTFMLLFLLAVILLPLTLFSQTKKDKYIFGKISKEELLESTCDFDKDAEAVVLLDYGKMYLDITGPQLYTELQVHTRIKILKKEGLKWADIKLRYKHYLNAQQINNISANTYNLDDGGNVAISRLDKKLVYEKKLTGKYTQENFTMPDVKVGSVI